MVGMGIWGGFGVLSFMDEFGGFFGMEVWGRFGVLAYMDEIWRVLSGLGMDLR